MANNLVRPLTIIEAGPSAGCWLIPPTAQEDIAAGRTRTFANAEDVIRWLQSGDDEKEAILQGAEAGES